MSAARLFATIGFGLCFQGAVYATTLKEAVVSAVETHPSISANEAEVRATGHEVDVARSGYFPSIDLSNSGGPQYTSLKTNNSALSSNFKGHATRWTMNPNATFTQIIFDGMATPYAVERARETVGAANATLGQTRENIAFQAVTAYINVYTQLQLLEIVQRYIKDHEELLQKVKKRVQGGIDTRADVYQVESRLEEVRAIKEGIEAQLEVARADFLSIVGFYPTAIEPPVMPESLPSTDIDDLLLVVYKKNPSIQVAESNLKIAEAVFDETISPFLPTVEAQANANAPVYNPSGIKGRTNTYTGQVVVTYNLYSGGKDTASRDAQRERVVKNKKLLAVARRQAEQTTRSALGTYLNAMDQQLTLQNAVAVDNQLESAYLKQFHMLDRPLVDLLNAYVSGFQDETNLSNTTASILINQAQILSALGALTRAFLD